MRNDLRRASAAETFEAADSLRERGADSICCGGAAVVGRASSEVRVDCSIDKSTAPASLLCGGGWRTGAGADLVSEPGAVGVGVLMLDKGRPRPAEKPREPSLAGIIGIGAPPF